MIEYYLKKVFSERTGVYRNIKINIEIIYITTKHKKMKIRICKMS